MLKKAISLTVGLGILFSGYLFYLTLGKPLIFLDSLKLAYSSGHRRIEKADSIAWLKIEDTSKLKPMYSLGKPMDKEAYLLIVESTYVTWGGYSNGKDPITERRMNGTVYTLHEASGRIQVFSEQKVPDYGKLSALGSLRILRLP